MPDVKVYLRDSISGVAVATDPDGGFAFCNLPAGLCSFGVVGPWGSWAGNRDFVVRADENGSPTHSLFVLPGPEQPDPGPVPSGRTPSGCGGPPPAAAPSGAPELAATGPGVTRLALSGLLTLLVGTGLVLIARQRPNGPGSRRT